MVFGKNFHSDVFFLGNLGGFLQSADSSFAIRLFLPKSEWNNTSRAKACKAHNSWFVQTVNADGRCQAEFRFSFFWSLPCVHVARANVIWVRQAGLAPGRVLDVASVRLSVSRTGAEKQPRSARSAR